MKKCVVTVFIVSLWVGNVVSGEGRGPVLSGPYLGQTPPGKTPELFAPGVITTDTSEGCSGWGNNMEFFVFQRWVDGQSRIYIMKQANGVWGAPTAIPFGERYQVGDFTIAPNGRTMVFASNILIEEIGSEGEGGNIWRVEKTADGWTEPGHVGAPVNTRYHDSYPCLAANGNLYFFSRKPGGYGLSDIYVAEFKGGAFRTPVSLGAGLNTEYHEWDTWIAPDESYMIYCSTKPGGMGEDDLYVTFRSEEGVWGAPIHMGNAINTDKSENRPYVSPGGKYFFYTSSARGNRDIYWVDASVIDDLRPDASGKGPHGAYFGQAPPGRTPEVFAPGFISTEKRELNSVFTPDGREFYFAIQTSGRGYRMYGTRQTRVGWTTPVPVTFSSERSDVDMCITADGRRMYFGSTRAVDGRDPGDFRIWYVERTGNGWSEAILLDGPVNDGERALYPTVSKNGTMYFQADRHDSFGGSDIYFSRWRNGRYTEPEHLGREINSQYGEGDVLIAPDESYLIVSSNGRPDDRGDGDLYISFCGPKGSWTALRNMGETINSPHTDYCPMLSPDGRFFFFTSRRSGNGDIYWVDAAVIDALRSE
jgi:Tol biopolymer transport system component